MCHSVCVICTDAVDSLSGPRRCPQFLHDYKKYVTHLITPFTLENIVYKITVTKSISNRRSSQVSLARPIPSTAATRPLLSRLVGVTMTVTWLVAHRIWLGKVHIWCPLDLSMSGDVHVMSRPSGAVKRDTKLSFFACCLARIISITQIHDALCFQSYTNHTINKIYLSEKCFTHKCCDSYTKALWYWQCNSNSTTLHSNTTSSAVDLRIQQWKNY